MTTIAELVVQAPGASTGVPIQVSYGSGQWRLVVQLADPAAGSSVVWYDITGYVEQMKWKRGADEPFGRYRACTPELLVRGAGDQFAPWNEDTSATFGTHVRPRGGLLVRAVVFRVVSSSVDLAFELFTARVKRWGDGSTSLGRSRFHKVTCLDTMSKLVNKAVGAQLTEGWKSRLDDLLTAAGWQFGFDIYGAVSVDGTPTVTLDDRDAVPSAIAELDATLDPVGLVWRTQPNGRGLVHPAPWTTFHDDIFGGAGTIVGTEWVSPLKAYYPGGVRFSYQPVVADGEVGFYPEADGQPFGIESDLENVVNEWKVTHPSGDYSYDDPVSASSYDTRPYPAATWIAQNDAVVDDYVDTRAYADMVAAPLRTSLDLPGFFPACVLLDQWDDVSVLHATRQERGTVTGTGWLRSIEHTIRNRRSGYISWKATLQLDLLSTEQSDPLLPVESLAVSAITTDQATFGWTNPSQTITPTETQIRIPELSDEWFPTAYPITSFAWLGLDAETTFRFQVRLVRVVDEIVTNVSPVREVTFTTPVAVVPVPDAPGTTVTIPSDPGGCTEIDWKLESSPDGSTWTLVDSGDESDFVTVGDETQLDLSGQSWTAGLLYRLCTRTACDPPGVGSYVCSVPFQPACTTPSQLSSAPFDDASLVMYVPQVCGATIEDAVSDTAITPGPAFAGVGYDDGGEYVLLSGATAGVVAYGDLPQLPLTDDDRSIHWRGKFDTAAAEDILLRVGRLRIAVIDVGAGVLKFAAIKSFAGGSITAIGTTTVASDTEYDVYATWDRSTATVAIVVDGTEEDTTEDAASYVNTPNLPTFSARLPANSWCTELAAWDTVLTSFTGGGGDTLPVTANLVAWYDASDTATITSDGSGNVSQWDDKSGNGYHVAQGTSGNQPNDSRATINSLTAIDFDGTTEHLTAFGIVGGGNVPFDSEYTVFMVVVVNSISNFDMFWALESSSPARRARSYMGTTQIDFHNWQSVLTNGSIKYYALPSTATTYIFTWKHSGTNASASLRRNGATLTATANPYANDIGTGSAPARISIGSDTGGNYADITVGEIVYYEAALDSTDTDAVESYLADKWGVTL